MDLLQKIESTRRADSRHEATAETQAAKLSQAQRLEQRRQENRRLWPEHFERLAASLRSSADHFEARAQMLIETK